MSYSFYVTLHLAGVILLFFSLGALTVHTLNGGDKESNKGRALCTSFHGLALVLLLVAGIGILHKHKLGFPVWAWAKVALWLLMGAAPVLIRRKPDWAKVLFFVLPALGALGAFLAQFKPGV